MQPTTRLCAALFLATGLLASLASTPAAADGDDHPSTVSGDAAEVGDVLAQGVAADGGCWFDEVRVMTTAAGDGTTRWLEAGADDQCRMVVTAKWQGELSEGPDRITELLLPLLLTESPPVPEEGSDDDGGVSAAVACRTSEQMVFMYGFGGPSDKLTRKTGRLTFCYDGVTATSSGQSGSCQGSSPAYWNWVVDACVLTSQNIGPNSLVWRNGRGDYHCSSPGTWPCNMSSPDGYYHSLYEEEDGHGDGTSHCLYGWSGNIVDGVNRNILQGCT